VEDFKRTTQLHMQATVQDVSALFLVHIIITTKHRVTLTAALHGDSVQAKSMGDGMWRLAAGGGRRQRGGGLVAGRDVVARVEVVAGGIGILESGLL